MSVLIGYDPLDYISLSMEDKNTLGLYFLLLDSTAAKAYDVFAQDPNTKSTKYKEIP